MDAAKDWTEIAYGVFEAHGYRIVAEKVAPEVFRYLVFAPPVSEIEHQRRCKTHYARGEHVPQRREPLGVFASAGEARGVCVAHAGVQT